MTTDEKAEVALDAVLDMLDKAIESVWDRQMELAERAQSAPFTEEQAVAYKRLMASLLGRALIETAAPYLMGAGLSREDFMSLAEETWTLCEQAWDEDAAHQLTAPGGSS